MFTELVIRKMEDVNGYGDLEAVPDDATDSRFPYRFALYGVDGGEHDTYIGDFDTLENATRVRDSLTPYPPIVRRVIVEVSGGVAEVTYCPEGVDVIILDWDNCPGCGGEECGGQGCVVNEEGEASHA